MFAGDLRNALLDVIAFILCVTVHEFGHAWVATRLGDSLPKAQGRLTLLPTRHMDPIGTLVMPLVLSLSNVPALAWGKPVQTNTMAYTRRFSRATGHMLVSVAGPAMNLLMAVVVSLVLAVLLRVGVANLDDGRFVFHYLVRLNFLLMLFNLLPVHPLDGGAVLEWLLPPSLQGISDFLRKYGFIILIVVLVSGGLQYWLAPVNTLSSWTWRALREASGR